MQGCPPIGKVRLASGIASPTLRQVSFVWAHRKTVLQKAASIDGSCDALSRLLRSFFWTQRSSLFSFSPLFSPNCKTNSILYCHLNPLDHGAFVLEVTAVVTAVRMGIIETRHQKKYSVQHERNEQKGERATSEREREGRGCSRKEGERRGSERASLPGRLANGRKAWHAFSGWLVRTQSQQQAQRGQYKKKREGARCVGAPTQANAKTFGSCLDFTISKAKGPFSRL